MKEGQNRIMRIPGGGGGGRGGGGGAEGGLSGPVSCGGVL